MDTLTTDLGSEFTNKPVEALLKEKVPGAVQSEYWIRRLSDPGSDGAFAIGHAVTSTVAPCGATAVEYELRGSRAPTGPPATVHPSLYFDARFWCDAESMSPMGAIGPYRALGWNARLDLLDDDALVDVPLPDTVRYFARELLPRCLPATKRGAIMAEKLILNPLESFAVNSIETTSACALCGTACASMWASSVPFGFARIRSPILGALCAARLLVGRAMVEHVRENPALWTDLANMTTDPRLKYLGYAFDVFDEGTDGASCAAASVSVVKNIRDVDDDDDRKSTRVVEMKTLSGHHSDEVEEVDDVEISRSSFWKVARFTSAQFETVITFTFALAIIATLVGVLMLSRSSENDEAGAVYDDRANLAVTEPSKFSEPPPLSGSTFRNVNLGDGGGSDAVPSTECFSKCETSSDRNTAADASKMIHVIEADPLSLSYRTSLADNFDTGTVILRSGKVIPSSDRSFSDGINFTWIYVWNDISVEHIVYPVQLVKSSRGVNYVGYIPYYHLENTPRRYDVIVRKVETDPYGAGRAAPGYYNSTMMMCVCACDPSFCNQPPSPPPLPPSPKPPPTFRGERKR
ncbi:hypothetical protein CYMTET_3253 [Cymbomonas tetramitiformis]|uniref:Uncharacterized protein n=2 Tax=Cymbomonas tetramitiformis TaxID=36881 RepID=A0AAE0LL12_9CHLO|nr:hypothetical protein CYMTET_3253 [Cymbomonas tetramitiformis]